VLLEAVVAGLPVLTTAVCGYAHYIAEADAGVVVAEPFDAARARLRLLARMLETSPRAGAGAATALALCRSCRHLQQCRTCGRRDPESAAMTPASLSRRTLPLVVGRQDPFVAVEALEGEVCRELEGRRTCAPKSPGAAISSRSIAASAGPRSPRTSLSLRLPVLGAANEWRAIQRLRELGVDSMRAVAFGRAAAIRRGNVVHHHRGTGADDQSRGLLPGLGEAFPRRCA
jgi:hypothetical protein